MSHFYAFTALLAAKCNKATRIIGQITAWLTAVMALVTTSVVIARAFGIGSIWAQESVIYMHAAVLTAVSAYTLSDNGHVRVDIFYRRKSPLEQAWIDALGTVLLLLPLAIFTVFISWDFVAHSWQHAESSQNAGGINGVYWLKSLIIVNGGLLCLQAIALLSRNILTLSFQSVEATQTESHD